MSGDLSSDPHQLLSTQEIEALRYLQDGYGAQVKQSAGEFAEAIGLDEVEAVQLVGKVAVQLEEQRIPFDERKALADLFRQLTIALGGTAIEGSDQPLARLELFVVQGTPETAESEDTEEPLSHRIEQLTASEPEPTIEPTPEHDDKDEDEKDQQTSSHLDELAKRETAFGDVQESWLYKVFSEEDVETIKNMDAEQRAECIKRLTDAYASKKIMRLNEEAKQIRAAQLSAFLSNQSYKQIAESWGVSPASIYQGITKMADTILKQMTSEELRFIVAPSEKAIDNATAKPVTDEAEPSESTILPSDAETSAESATTPDEGLSVSASEEVEVDTETISAELKEMLEAIAGKDGLHKFVMLTVEQRAKFATQFHELYIGLGVNKLNEADKLKRADISVNFLNGRSFEEIAETYGMKLSKASDTLRRIADNVAKRVAPQKIIELIEAAGTIESSENLNRLQRRWLSRVFPEADDMETLESLSTEQRSELAERLGNHVSSLVLARKKHSKVESDRRRLEISLLLEGKDIEEIAEQSGLDEQTVRNELYHSAKRLKTIPSNALNAILESIRLMA